jgi:DNA repair photolyase
MTETPISAKSLLRWSRRIDSWFVSRAGMNLYRGCGHGCAYCDGRAEKYRVEGDFSGEIGVKVNALRLLERELAGAGLAASAQGELWAEEAGPRGSGFILLGGGVGDSYQPAEDRHGLARGALEMLEAHDLPVHVLTKSTLVLRDADILGRIHSRRRAVVSFSISTIDDSLAAVFEPGAPPPSLRLAAMAELTRQGIPCGLFLLPVLPFLTDSPEQITRAVQAAAKAGARFILFGGMTLKAGRQMEHYLGVLQAHSPELVQRTRALYPPDPWGSARGSYYRGIGKAFSDAVITQGTPVRMPLELFGDIVSPEDRARVLVEHARAKRELQISFT